MINLDEAYRIVMRSVFETDTEIIPFTGSCGRILDEDIASDIDMPPFNRSAVDGYACHKVDLNNDLKIIEIIPAGKVPVHKVGSDECSKIMTGAIVPEGCDLVFMVEDSETREGGKVRYTGVDPKVNISIKGEDIKTGENVLRRRTLIKPQDIAVMASVGHTNVRVKKKPLIGIISTGDELVDPVDVPGISQIRNSNAYQLLAQISRAGGESINFGIAPDSESITYDVIKKAVEQCDILIVTGGVSMGDFDFVPRVLERSGVKILFDRINVQPGKPTTFGVHPKSVIFGLPGNPVSSFIQFEILVRPLINKMMSHDWSPDVFSLPMAVNFERKSSVRLGLIPVMINENREVLPVEVHGSAHLTALTYSDGIISMDPGINSLVKGETVDVRQI